MQRASQLADELLLCLTVPDELAVVVDAESSTRWPALGCRSAQGRAELTVVPVVGALRVLPGIAGHLLYGARPSAAPDRLTLRVTTELPMSGGGWILLGEPADEQVARWVWLASSGDL
ncbi:MAG: hypothetical protein WBP81_00795 [Solirubrobacteraceae bacterium]